MGLTLDTGALIALERGRHRVDHLVRVEQRRGEDVTIPAPVLAQFWRGGWISVELRTILDEVTIEPTTRPLAQRAGELLGQTDTSDVVDAIVACGAAARGDVILTSDPEDLQRLTARLGTVRVLAV